MIVEKKPGYARGLRSILRYVANDKISASLKFERELEQRLLAWLIFHIKIEHHVILRMMLIGI